MPTIILATGNPHKVTELRAIFREAHLPGIELLGLSDISTPLDEPAETGDTFERNAVIKAIGYCRQIGRPCLADDSGLIIDALSGRPGVISSHYSTDGLETGLSRDERDALNIQRVLRELSGVPFDRRTARFTCVMALAVPSQRGDNPRILCTTQGTYEGRIGFPAGESTTPALIVPRGEHGFGYDPLLLLPPDFHTTSSQLPPDVKNRLSHRSMAARRMADELRAAVQRGDLV